MKQPNCRFCNNTGAVGPRYCNCPSAAPLRERIQSHPKPEVRANVREIQSVGALVDVITERRLLAAFIAEPRVLAMADDVEEQDFTDPRCRHVLRAIRQLRQDGADVGPDEIDHEIRLQDMDRERIGSGAIVDQAGFWFVVGLLLDFCAYGNELTLAEHDMAWLRDLSNRRRGLRSAA